MLYLQLSGKKFAKLVTPPHNFTQQITESYTPSQFSSKAIMQLYDKSNSFLKAERQAKNSRIWDDFVAVNESIYLKRFRATVRGKYTHKKVGKIAKK